MDLGFEVLAYYYEPGMGFCGRVDKTGDKFYNLEHVRINEVPNDIVDEMGIEDEMLEED